MVSAGGHTPEGAHFQLKLSLCWRSFSLPAGYYLAEGEISSRSCDILPRLMFTRVGRSKTDEERTTCGSQTGAGSTRAKQQISTPIGSILLYF